MRITLNLATRPYADQGPALKRLRIGMAALAVVLALLGWGMLHFHQSALRMRAQEDEIDRKIAAIEREEQGYQAQMQQPANAKVLTQAQFLNKLFDEKSFSWTAAMEDLERVLPAGVQVTAIEPSRAKDGRLTLRLHISGLRERSVEMVRNMEHSQRFAAPRIAGESSENSDSQAGLQPVRDTGKVSFDVLAEYNPATLEERKAQIAAQRRPPAAAAPQIPAPQRSPRQPYSPPRPSPPIGNRGPNAGMSVNPVPSPGQNPAAGPNMSPAAASAAARARSHARMMPGGVPVPPPNTDPGGPQ